MSTQVVVVVVVGEVKALSSCEGLWFAASIKVSKQCIERTVRQLSRLMGARVPGGQSLISPPRVLKYVTRIAIEMHDSDRR